LFTNSLLTGTSVNPSFSIFYTGYVNSTGYLSLSGTEIGTTFYIGDESLPLVKGVQFNNETGLVYYLSGQSAHKVSSYFDGLLVKFASLYSGSLGNDIFIRNLDCNKSPLSDFSSNLTGGLNIGATGLSVYSINQPFSGFVNTVITGSGLYSQAVTGNQEGYFTFSRTFTVAWDLLTGFSQDALFAVAETNSERISGHAILGPNSSVIFQINHYDSDFNIETVKFTVSGNEIFNPIQTIILQ